MNTNMTMGRKPVKGKGFPAGIFFFLFFTEVLLSVAGTAVYFYYGGRSGISEIERYTRSYSVTMAEAFARVAEMGYRNRKHARLSALFHEKIGENVIDEAFFVLKDGKLVAHYSTDVEKKMKGSLANDEFAYNLDLILQPARKGSSETQFTDYNYMSLQVPFREPVRKALKDYFYKGIESTGWLASRAVFIDKKPVGTVSLIIGKKRVYEFIWRRIRISGAAMTVSVSAAFIISLVISLVVFVRTRSAQKSALLCGSPEDFYPVEPSDIIPFNGPETAQGHGAQDAITIELTTDAGRSAARPAAAVTAGEFKIAGREIKNAIPVKGVDQ
ncbi:MAG: hypothetical protein MUD12_06885 [Spirochaetes bacterium]|jgi:hypothetical protein|nr:hypothetical protein [Spirochaetota bacterium]